MIYVLGQQGDQELAGDGPFQPATGGEDLENALLIERQHGYLDLGQSLEGLCQARVLAENHGCRHSGPIALTTNHTNRRESSRGSKNPIRVIRSLHPMQSGAGVSEQVGIVLVVLDQALEGRQFGERDLVL